MDRICALKYEIAQHACAHDKLDVIQTLVAQFDCHADQLLSCAIDNGNKRIVNYLLPMCRQSTIIEQLRQVQDEEMLITLAKSL